MYDCDLPSELIFLFFIFIIFLSNWCLEGTNKLFNFINNLHKNNFILFIVVLIISHNNLLLITLEISFMIELLSLHTLRFSRSYIQCFVKIRP